ncbi:RNA binding protein (contains ribosomal protein S1 domain) [Legionella sainthelensi]|uniref:RNA binding protein (Contains ribosomal protein S1 domain) n=1 Tax=Legionella sainthelensi TaxID=28087 RepID=A0A0W0YUQ2_9GAMM|nr:hypothetical protein [Legionella sainthelensi]KTD60593.1 RNA binding protein (contains ribosomal protein S1 domain) [Legionella sainthelensi]VEH30971.1 RNA binding protein (contains ribosomal protein S1 domain) [Legionella sainthelensi]
MKILYIPFHEENDLCIAATLWKRRLSEENILIIQHGQPIDYNVLKNAAGTITLYVLAHGIDSWSQPFHLASHSIITSKTTQLDIEKIADRFNSDFVYLHHKINHIKLFFCNNKGSQKLIAERFNKNLILFSSPIDYYAGIITSPWQDKIKYSLFQGTWYKTSKVRNTLYQKKDSMDADIRLTVKERSMREFLANAKQKRIDKVLQRQSKARQERLIKNRGYCTEQHKLSLEDAANEPSNLTLNHIG